MKVKAFAKVNLALDVVRKMENGYHELDMIMAPISLYDEVDIEFADTDHIECSCLLPEKNTVTKTLEVLRRAHLIKRSYAIRIVKHIPEQAGLAGGSADAAAVLKVCLAMEDQKVALEDLLNIAKEIGADVPFCVVNQLARVKGIGEKITCLNSSFSFPVLLVKPDFGVSTPETFARWKKQEKPLHPDVDLVQTALKQESYDLLYQTMQNALEPVAIEMCPELLEIKKDMAKHGIVKTLMSGSGSTMMGFSINLDILQEAKEELSKKYPFVKIVQVGV